MKNRKKRKSNKDSNFLPTHVGSGFLSGLTQLVDHLADTQGPKGEYLKSEFLSKFSDESLTPAELRQKAGIQKWMAAEASNRTTNSRLYQSQMEDVDLGWTTTDTLIGEARRIISKVLGPLEPATLFTKGTHTNGASTRVRRSPKAALQKHVGKAHVTESALKYWYSASAGTCLSRQELELVSSSVLFTVPKASDIDRVACKEPEINMFLQRCAGSHIRKRLRKAGIDLNDQTINQRLARDALHMGLATIDLSSASDSITKGLVMRLLPMDWWSLLDDIRVHQVETPDGLHTLEMFSSMGNGFTFELESLIFWALTRAVCKYSGIKGRISVYGDDIICSSRVGPRLAKVFSWFGFKVNAKKSNWDGLFRESCGKHYHNSLDVTPFYVRGPITSLTDVIRVLNRLLLWDDCGFGCLTTPEVIEFHRKWSKSIPFALHGGQDPESDTALVTGDRPRKRLLRKIRPMEFDQQAGLLYWLTASEKPKENLLPKMDPRKLDQQFWSLFWCTARETTYLPLSCDPGESGRFFIADQPSWQRCTAWSPYLIEDETLRAPSGGNPLGPVV